jgi:putative oxidoreductase
VNLGLLILRVTIGLLFIGHGSQKLWGLFGGHGVAGTGGFFEGLGFRPGRLHAILAGGSEFAGGLLLALGLLTPVAAAMLTAVMLTAILTVHASKGVWVTEGGYEYNLVLLAAVFALSAVGAGAWSLDHALGLSLSGTEWALGELGAGAIGAAVTITAAQLTGQTTERSDYGTPGTTH